MIIGKGADCFQYKYPRQDWIHIITETSFITSSDWFTFV